MDRSGWPGACRSLGYGGYGLVLAAPEKNSPNWLAAGPAAGEEGSASGSPPAFGERLTDAERELS